MSGGQTSAARRSFPFRYAFYLSPSCSAGAPHAHERPHPGRAETLHPRLIDLSLGRIEALLAKLGNPAASPAAGHPRRRHQRQGLDRRLPQGHAGGGRQARARLHLAAPRALPRAHRAGGRRRQGAADRRRTSWSRCCERVAARQRRRTRSPSSRSPPRRPSSPSPSAPADAVILEVGPRRPARRHQRRRTAARCRSSRRSRIDHADKLGATRRQDRRREGRHPQARRHRRRSRARRRRRSTPSRPRASGVRRPARSVGQDFEAFEQRGRLVYQSAERLMDLPLPALMGRAPDRQRRHGDRRRPASCRRFGLDRRRHRARARRRALAGAHAAAGRRARCRACWCRARSCGSTAATIRPAPRPSPRRWPSSRSGRPSRSASWSA